MKQQISELMKRVDCRYTLVVAVSKRARQLVDGREPLISTDETKAVNIAIEEVELGLIRYRRNEAIVE